MSYFLAGEKAERCTSQFAIVGFSVAARFSLHFCKLRHIAWHLALPLKNSFGLRAFHESNLTGGHCGLAALVLCKTQNCTDSEISCSINMTDTKKACYQNLNKSR